MEKLLHERLRVEDGSALCPVVFDDAVGALLTATEARHLANEIERYYVPRPRFEDGEPVYRGDEIEVDDITSKVDGIHVVADKQDSDETMFYLHNGIMVGRATSIPAKRPQPKALDADGVPIIGGDTVYFVDYPELSWTVKNIRDGKVDLERDTGSFSVNVYPGFLTHKEPDSLEKLRDDIADYLDACSDEWEEMRKYADRLSAIIERGK